MASSTKARGGQRAAKGKATRGTQHKKKPGKKAPQVDMPAQTKPSNQDANWWQVRVTLNGLKTFLYHLNHSPNTSQKLVNQTKDIHSWFKSAVVDPQSNTPLENMFQTANRQIKECVQIHAMECGCVQCFTLYTKDLQQIRL